MSRLAKYKPDKYQDLMMPTDDMDDCLERYQSKLVKVRKDTTCSYCGLQSMREIRRSAKRALSTVRHTITMIALIVWRM